MAAQIKSDVINGAYGQLRISGLTVNPTPEDITTALKRLENMAAEFDARNICTSFNIQDAPDPSDLTNVEQMFWHMLETNLALRLAPDFGKEVPGILLAQASQSLSAASSVIASNDKRFVQAPHRMPIGSGNTLRYNKYQRFHREPQLPPIACTTNVLFIKDINDFSESFEAYLNDGEVISSFELTVDQAMRLLSSANASPFINYRLEAVSNIQSGRWQQVKIKITTDSGRVTTRFMNFDIQSNETVGEQTNPP